MTVSHLFVQEFWHTLHTSFQCFSSLRVADIHQWTALSHHSISILHLFIEHHSHLLLFPLCIRLEICTVRAPHIQSTCDCMHLCGVVINIHTSSHKNNRCDKLHFNTQNYAYIQVINENPGITVAPASEPSCSKKL